MGTKDPTVDLQRIVRALTGGNQRRKPSGGLQPAPAATPIQAERVVGTRSSASTDTAGSAGIASPLTAIARSEQHYALVSSEGLFAQLVPMWVDAQDAEGRIVRFVNVAT